MSLSSSRFAWPLLMGLVAFAAVWLATHNLQVAIAIALLPVVLGVLNVLKSVGYALTGLAVIYAVFVYVTPPATRAGLASGVANAFNKATAKPNAVESGDAAQTDAAESSPPRRGRHRHAQQGG